MKVVIGRMLWLMLVASAICVAAAKEDKPKPGQLQQKTDTPHRHIYSGGFANDFASSSVDLNQDGQPDNQQTYNMLPSSNPNYPYVVIPINVAASSDAIKNNYSPSNDLNIQFTGGIAQQQIGTFTQTVTVPQTTVLPQQSQSNAFQNTSNPSVTGFSSNATDLYSLVTSLSNQLTETSLLHARQIAALSDSVDSAIATDLAQDAQITALTSATSNQVPLDHFLSSIEYVYQQIVNLQSQMDIIMNDQQKPTSAPPTMISTTIPEYTQKYVRCSDNLLFLKFDSVRYYDPNDYNCGENANTEYTLKKLCCEQDPSGHSCNIEAIWFIFLNDFCPSEKKVLEVKYTCVQASACSKQE